MCNFVEADDYIEVNGAVFHKPFVEKPVSAEDHNVYIYFPSSAGGGSQRLFRKVGSLAENLWWLNTFVRTQFECLVMHLGHVIMHER